MAVRTGRRRRRLITEQVPLGKPERVDRAAGVVFGVKVCGLQSRNGRRYLPEALKKAAGLYEGASVRVNHPKKGTDARDAHDAIGWLENVRQGPDGSLYGDLHLLLEHELTPRVLEAAERNPKVYGLSHNADGEYHREGGLEVVTEVLEVRSVDLVLDPATTGGLFEERAMPITLGRLLEAVKLSAPQRRLVSRLVEDGYMAPSLAMGEDVAAPGPDAPAADHLAALRSGFEASCSAVIAQALDGEMDPKEALKKLRELIATHAKLMDRGEAAEPVKEEDDGEPERKGKPDDDDDGKGDGSERVEECNDMDKKKYESVQAELAALKAKEAVRELCEAEGVRPGKALLAALAALKGDERKALLEDWRAGQQGGADRKPRTQLRETAGANTTGPVAARDIKTAQDFARALRGDH